MKFITVNGLSRSGNHAIIRWMVGQYKDSGYEVFFHNNAIKNFLEYFNLRGGGGLQGMPVPNPKLLEIILHLTRNDKKVFIVSFEDLLIDERLGEITSMADHNVVILRDPYNLFASRIQGLTPPRGRKDWSDPSEPKNIQKEEIKKYISHYEEFSNKKSNLKNKVCINYNKWVLEEDYRSRVSESNFGIKFTDACYGHRACSSFGPKAPIELSSKNPEDFVTRYEVCLDDPLFKKIMEDEALASIALETFGIEIK
jgi:hypothetical protein